MVQRQSEAVSFLSRQGAGQVSQAAAGAVRPDFSNPTSKSIRIDDGVDRILSNLLGTADKLANQVIDRAQQESYLEGASKIGQIESEDELQGNPLTRDWQVAGYRDTAGRLKLADSEAQLAADMKFLREQPPEKFQEYLATRRPDLVSTMEGMSYEQRQATFGKLLLNDVAGTRQHTTEHAKFIIETEQKSIAASAAVAVQSLSAARNSGDFEAYKAYRDSAAGVLQKDILMNPKLPASLKQSMTVEYLEGLLNSDNVEAYEYLNSTPMLHPDGNGSSPVVGRLSLEDQAKLGTKYREAVQRNQHLRNVQFFEQKAQAESAMTLGNYDWTYDKAKAFADMGMRTGAMKAGDYEGFLQKHLEYVGKTNNLGALADAGVRGDLQGIVNLGKSEEDAARAIVSFNTKQGKPLPEIVGQLMRAGTNGMGQAYKVAGELMAPSFRQLARPDGTIDKQHAAMIEGVHHALEASEKGGLTSSTSQFLSTMPEDVQTRVLRIREHLRGAGGALDMQGALTATLAAESREAGMSPAVKASIAGATAAEHREFLSGLEPRGVLSTIGLKVASAFSSSAQAELAIRPFDKWFDEPWMGDDNVVQQAAARAKAAVGEEIQAVSLAHPELPAGAQQSMALARVHARTVGTDAGPIILPRGADAAKFFKVRPEDRQMIGPAINALLKKESADQTEAAQFTFEVAQGKLQYVAFDEDGAVLRNRLIDPSAVAAELQTIYRGKVVELDKASGAGVELKRDGLAVKFNGANGAGVEDSLVLKFRENLVQGEGIKNRVYKDTRGVLTVGVGVSEKSTHWVQGLKEGDVVPQEQMERMFLAASNDAVKQGAAIAAQAGLPQQGILLASELAYQAGPGHISAPKYPEMYAAIVRKDKAAAISAFRETFVHKVSGPARRKHYEQLINDSMR